MRDWLEVFKPRLELFEHGLVNRSVFLLRLEYAAELDPFRYIFQINQSQVIEGQEGNADNIVVARLDLPVHGNADDICHDLRPNVRNSAAAGQAPELEFTADQFFNRIA